MIFYYIEEQIKFKSGSFGVNNNERELERTGDMRRGQREYGGDFHALRHLVSSWRVLSPKDQNIISYLILVGKAQVFFIIHWKMIE